MRFKKLLAFSMLLPLLFPILPAFAMERLGGQNRYETAVAVSRHGWDGAPVVVLARGDDPVDALAGVPLAHLLDAPILLTKSDFLVTVTEGELSRLQAKHVVILGNTGAVSSAVEDQLVSMGLSVERIGGDNRFETAAAIASMVSPCGAQGVFIVNAFNYHDGLLAAPYAAKQNIPILLTDSDRLPKASKEAVSLFETKETVVIGNTASVNDSVLTSLPSPVRISGRNRYLLSVNLATIFAPRADSYLISSGQDYIDSLPGAVFAAKNDTGILLADRVVPHTIAEFLQSNPPYYLTILGETGAISDETVATLSLFIRDDEERAEKKVRQAELMTSIGIRTGIKAQKTQAIMDEAHVLVRNLPSSSFRGELEDRMHIVQLSVWGYWASVRR